MTCREFLEALSEDPADGGTTSPAASAHRAACAECAAAADDARDAWTAVVRSGVERSGDDGPPARTAEAWAAATTTSPLRRLAGRVRTAARAAVVLLAIVGAAAALGAQVESDGGRVTMALSLPWGTAEPRPSSPSPAELLAEADRRAEARELLREEARAQELLRWAEWLDDRRRADVDAIVAEMTRLRTELAATRWAAQELVAAGAGPPALPDIR